MRRRIPDPLCAIDADERFDAKLRREAAMPTEQRARRLAAIDARERRVSAYSGVFSEDASDADMEGADCVEAMRGDVLPSERMYGRRS